MSVLSRSWSRPELGAAALFVAAAAVFLASWSLLHTHHYTAHQLIDTPTYETYGQAIARRLRAVPRLRRRVPAGRAARVRGADLCHDGLRVDVRLADGRARRRAAWRSSIAAGRAVVVGRRSSRVSPLAARLHGGDAATTSGRPRCSPARSRRCSRDRHRLGWGLLGAAVAAKLYPLVVVPLVVLWTLRRRGRRELACAAAVGAAVLAVAFVPFLVVAPGGLWDSVWGQLSRPLQIESLAASLVTTFGNPLIESSHGSQNVAGHGTLAALSSVCGSRCSSRSGSRFARGPADREPLRPLRGRVRVRVRRVREGALAAVPDLARPARRTRPRSARARGGRAAGRRARRDRGVVPGPLLGLRQRARPRVDRAACGTCCWSRSSRVLSLPARARPRSS